MCFLLKLSNLVLFYIKLLKKLIRNYFRKSSRKRRVFTAINIAPSTGKTVFLGEGVTSGNTCNNCNSLNPIVGATAIAAISRNKKSDSFISYDSKLESPLLRKLYKHVRIYIIYPIG